MLKAKRESLRFGRNCTKSTSAPSTEFTIPHNPLTLMLENALIIYGLIGVGLFFFFGLSQFFQALRTPEVTKAAAWALFFFLGSMASAFYFLISLFF